MLDAGGGCIGKMIERIVDGQELLWVSIAPERIYCITTKKRYNLIKLWTRLLKLLCN